jgi:hypothetical protein
LVKSHLNLVAPTEVKRTVAPGRRPNAELRTREHLTPTEIEAVIEAAIGALACSKTYDCDKSSGICAKFSAMNLASSGVSTSLKRLALGSSYE